MRLPFLITDEHDKNLFVAREGRLILTIISLTMVLGGIVGHLILLHETGELRAGLPLALAGLIALTLIHQGKDRLAVSVILWSLVLIPLWFAFTLVGLRAPSLAALPIAAMAAGWLLGTRQAIALGGTGALGVALLYLMHTSGIQFSAESVTPSQLGLSLLTTILMGAIFGATSTSTFRKQYRQVAQLSQDLQQQLDEVTRSEKRFVTLFRANPLPSLTVNADGRYLDVNDSWVKTFGIPRIDAIGKTTLELNLWADLTERQLLLDEVQNGTVTQGRSTQLNTANGTVRHFLLNLASVEVYGEIRRIITLVDQTDRLAAEDAQRVLNTELESRVVLRTEELGRAITQLKRAQEELVKSETLASLGSMVAGISHELNTPIGNALTVATTLEAQFAEINASIHGNTLKRSVLDAFVARGAEMAQLISRSIERAADLISSFKQVAVDQTSDQRRRFDLCTLVNDNLATLRPGHKNRPLEIINCVPAGIECDSYPGPLGQIITNLVQNAAMHAFDGVTAGTIQVTANEVDCWIELRILDDGVGMVPQVLAHIFDPFFTTKLGVGGSGLGLSICHRIATSILGGQLTATSEQGKGSQFSLRFPATSPGRI